MWCVQVQVVETMVSYPDVIKLLLDHGEKPDHRNKEGRTPLVEAALW
jgi:ankyrin repeat protein